MSGIDRRSLMAASGALLAANSAKAGTAKAGYSFPNDFLWGAATSGHQVEGNNVNSDMWLLEHLKVSPFKEPSRDADDHYHLFEQDIAMLAKLGLNSFRFSLEWARIEPARGEFSAAEMNHYVQVSQACLKHGVKPVLTYNHYAVPVWFAANGGFEKPEAVDLFARFCEYTTKAIGPYVAVAATFNEPQLGVLLRWMLPGFVIAGMEQAMTDAAKLTATPLFSSIQFGNLERMQPILIAAHHKAYEVIKSGPGDFPVGVTIALHDDQAVGDNSRRDEKRAQCYGPWLEAARSCDFIGVQNYSRARIDAKGTVHPDPGAELNQNGEEFWPEALEASIRYAWEQTGKPVYVTENGVSIADDSRRVEFINRAVAGVANCLRDGLPVRSYIHWSLLDNFNWVSGYAKQIGLVAVDRTTQQRTLKPSAVRLGQIAKANRI
ncbi:beta-glucosidase A [Asticcacaulis biprosthecium C19]|uniref:Beta-glucosidase A n=1 Tax=Asticcacaulis biprosthecium C19 TaxID=715226 RepID=F4QNW2_9CAUL|nr:family 1 glycosylhydrolase [Asticcacaulis biprosthecium]EGF91020.1 beta-glucosidase A [Asticcacaulis biprosthecium C19]